LSTLTGSPGRSRSTCRPSRPESRRSAAGRSPAAATPATTRPTAAYKPSKARSRAHVCATRPDRRPSRASRRSSSVVRRPCQRWLLGRSRRSGGSAESPRRVDDGCPKDEEVMTDETQTAWKCPKDGTVMQPLGQRWRGRASRWPTCRGIFIDTEAMRHGRPPKRSPVLTSVLVSLLATAAARRLRQRSPRQSSS
jgi:hypothetical protein